jgi:hypothetical protein
MRDLINIIDNIFESSLSASELTKYDWRFKKFIEKIQNKDPFTSTDDEEIVIDPNEADRFVDMYDKGQFQGSIKAKTIDGSDIGLSKLAKTTEFGGAAIAKGQEISQGGKESFLVKPSQINITDKNIPAENLYDEIKNNEILRSTDYGKVIIGLATNLVSEELAKLPEEYTLKDKEKIRKAIVDYAGEYLGVLALLNNRSRFPRKKQFENWLGSEVSALTLNFPSKSNTNLADSFASIINPNTSHTINISSKGTGGGAAPAISGLKVPEHIKNNPNYDTAVKFIDICQKQNTIQQAFSAMDLIYKTNPKSIDEKWHDFLPFSQKNPNLLSLCKQSIDSKKQKVPIELPNKYQILIQGQPGKGTDGGKLVYGIKKEVAESINNKNGLPEFKDAILEILEMNFLQQYCDYKNGVLTFATQWPAKLDGEISVENKSTTSEPTAGGFSFKLGRTDDSVSSEPGVPRVDGIDDKDFEKSASAIADEPLANVAKSPRQVGDVGRMKRKA